MGKYPPEDEVVRRIKNAAEKTLNILPRSLPMAIAAKNNTLAHHNVGSGASSCLKVGMVCARRERNYLVAKQHFSRGADYANSLTELAAQGLSGTPWSGFYVLHCAVLGGRWNEATTVANWMVACPPVAEDSAEPGDPFALLSGLALLDRREKFESYRSARFDRSWHATHPFYGPLSVYLDLSHAILKRDQSSFDSLMRAREEFCIRLSAQKEPGRSEFGGGEQSKYVIDFMGVASAVLARKLGMTCSIDTEYVPAVLVECALN